MSGVMGVAIFSSAVLGIISRFLIDDLGITRTQLGWLAFVVSITAALSSPQAGHIADRIGGRSMALAVFAISGLGLLAMSASPTYLVLLAAGLLAGLGQSGANPSTNKLIRLYIPTGNRGLVTGIKQSGVQAGLFLGGLTIPALAVAHGWRTALALVLIAPAIGLIVTGFLLPRDEPRASGGQWDGGKQPLPRAIHWIAAQGVLVGAAAASIITYLPLYAEEEVGLSVQTAGVVVSVYGLAGLFSRLAFPAFGEKAPHLAYPMLVVVSVAFTGTVLMWLSQAWGVALLWVGAVLVGAQVAWTALGMLAVITQIEQHQAGRASGVVTRGFGIGLALGPPIFGFSVDTTGAYHVGFGFLLAVMVGSAVLMVMWLREDQAPTSAA